MKATFTTILQKDSEKNAAGIRIPVEVIEALGGGREAAGQGHDWRLQLSQHGRFVGDGVYMVGVSQERRAAMGIDGGDEIEVTLELDTEPRTVDLPEDLAAALADAGARAAFDALAYSARKEYVRQSRVGKGAGDPRTPHRGYC